ncbi:hypothetical protein QE152_g5038 [Popillia japonica]|uniref:Uncharacterized protein n=1 Tax=Popillia japonica TaxID=7064 RepID=A0AAW1MY56_POPJA
MEKKDEVEEVIVRDVHDMHDILIIIIACARFTVTYKLSEKHRLFSGRYTVCYRIQRMYQDKSNLLHFVEDVVSAFTARCCIRTDATSSNKTSYNLYPRAFSGFLREQAKRQMPEFTISCHYTQKDVFFFITIISRHLHLPPIVLKNIDRENIFRQYWSVCASIRNKNKCDRPPLRLLVQCPILVWSRCKRDFYDSILPKIHKSFFFYSYVGRLR